jgi:hypothetical protein
MNTVTRAIIQQRPFHLSYYEDDLSYRIKEVSLVRDCQVVRKEGDTPKDNEYFLAIDGPDRAYVRMFYCKSTKEYAVAMTFTPWPAFAEDPFHSGSSVLVGESSLQRALEGIHRMYFYYRHESRRPVPYDGYYMDVVLTPEAIADICENLPS